MKIKHFHLVSWLIALATGLTFSLAAEPTLKVGDPAPKLQTGKWVQGDAVKDFEKGKAYIVEFWATWCGPCRATIPHVNELHQKFASKGLVVIGQDCWERDLEKVAPFLKEMGDKMTYRVALDTVADPKNPNTGAMATTWMKAAGQNGIPCAFLVDKKGTIAWIGHPAKLKESDIESLLAGTFDIAKAKREVAEEVEYRKAMTEHNRAIGTAMQAKNWDEA